jgi:hypothetical protein
LILVFSTFTGVLGEPVPVDVIVPVDKDWRPPGPPLGTADFSQFKGPANLTPIFTFVVVSALHTAVLLLLGRVSPSSSTIVRLIEVESEKSPGSQVFPGASTPWRIRTMFRISVDPFPAVATFLRET